MIVFGVGVIALLVLVIALPALLSTLFRLLFGLVCAADDWQQGGGRGSRS